MEHAVRLSRTEHGWIAYCEECQRDGRESAMLNMARYVFLDEFPHCERPASTPQEDLDSERYPY